MRMKKAYAAAVLLIAAACKTNDDGAALKEQDGMPIAPQANSGQVMNVSGDAALDVYEATNLNADANGTKRHAGRLSFVCFQEGGLPPGAQGFPGQMTYSCAASVPLPSGAQGFPAPPFMRVEGDAAMKVWEGFTSQASWSGGAYEKVFETQNGEYICKKSGNDASCSVGGAGSVQPGGGGGDNPPENNTPTGVLLTLTGTAAKTVYQKLQIGADAQGVKKKSGRLAVFCTQQGALPPGAQGFPGQISYTCAARVPLPQGAMGFPAPPFLSLDGTNAMKFWEAFQIPSKWVANAGWYEKSFHVESGAEFACKKTGNSHKCTLTNGGSGGGGGSTGDAKVSLSGDAATQVYAKTQLAADGSGTKRHAGRLAVFCMQKGALPPGAQGFPGQMTYSCSARVPLPNGAMGFPAPPFMSLDGQTAMKFWEGFQTQAKWQGGGSYYEKSFASDAGEFVCTKGASGSCTVRGQ